MGTQRKHDDTDKLTKVQEEDRLRYKRTNEVKHRCIQKKGGGGGEEKERKGEEKKKKKKEEEKKRKGKKKKGGGGGERIKTGSGK